MDHRFVGDSASMTSKVVARKASQTQTGERLPIEGTIDVWG